MLSKYLFWFPNILSAWASQGLLFWERNGLKVWLAAFRRMMLMSERLKVCPFVLYWGQMSTRSPAWCWSCDKEPNILPVVIKAFNVKTLRPFVTFSRTSNKLEMMGCFIFPRSEVRTSWFDFYWFWVCWQLSWVGLPEEHLGRSNVG